MYNVVALIHVENRDVRVTGKSGYHPTNCRCGYLNVDSKKFHRLVEIRAAIPGGKKLTLLSVSIRAGESDDSQNYNE